jgi:gamma-glutamylcyclotransferase (GGCT)/AIG2-like uncharacterized protein YtfP
MGVKERSHLNIEFLFVYGKLREYYAVEEHADVESFITLPAKTTGKMYEYDGDAVVIEDKNGFVYGNLISSTNIDILLRHTDNFMEFNENNYENSRYIRGIKEIEIETLGEKIKAWCYVFPTSRKSELDKNGCEVQSGDWLEYKRSLENKDKIV